MGSNLKINMNFQVPFIEIDGTPKQDLMIAKMLYELLLTEQNGDAMKYYIWGTMLRDEKGILEIDKADYQTLYDLVKSTPRWTATLKAQVMLIMQDAKDKPAPPKERGRNQ